MPKLASASASKPAAPKKELVPQSLEVLYPDLEMIVCHGDGKTEVKCTTRPAMTARKMMELLGWTTEADYIKRRLQADPTLKEDDAGFPKNGVVKLVDEETGQPLVDCRGKPVIALVMLTDENGDRVICTNNCANRPFEESTARKYKQDTINRNWAGPTTLPEETINGETFIIDRYGQVISGQHRGVGLILAYQEWLNQCKLKAGQAYVMWPPEQYPNGPVMDVPIFRGVSNHPKVIRSLDNVRPRSTADTVYTSPIFAGMNPEQKRECARMMDVAVDFLWQRTAMKKSGTTVGAAHRIQTHSESIDFIERHETLKKCVEHIRKCDRDSAIRNLRVSPGLCAGVMYLMAVSDSDINEYINAEPLPGEKSGAVKVLSFKRWEVAKQFWLDIKEGEGNSDVIREKMSELVDEDGTRVSEKLCLLALAWAATLDESNGGRILKSDLSLDDLYIQDENKNWLLGPDAPNFGGIDQWTSNAKAEVSETEANGAKAKIDAENQERQRKLKEEADAKIAQFNANRNSGGAGPNGEWVPPKSGSKPDAPAPAKRPAAKPSDKLRGGIGG